MNTPPRSQLPTFSFPSSTYTRAPKRPYCEQSISPPRLRPFEDLDDSFSKHYEIERERFRKLEKEKEMKQDIIRQLKLVTCEDWLVRGSTEFSGIYPNL